MKLSTIIITIITIVIVALIIGYIRMDNKQQMQDGVYTSLISGTVATIIDEISGIFLIL